MRLLTVALLATMAFGYFRLALQVEKITNDHQEIRLHMASLDVKMAIFLIEPIQRDRRCEFP